MRRYNPLRLLLKPLWSLSGYMEDGIRRLSFRYGTKHTIHNLPVSMECQNTKHQRISFEKIGSALDLISEFAPERYRALKIDVSSVFITEELTGYGRYWQKQKMVGLRESYVRDPETSQQELACSLIHEAQHGRLFRMGIGYEEPIRARVERVCMTAERNFARKLLGCEALVEHLQERLEYDWEPYLTNKARWLQDAEAILQRWKEDDCPQWMIRVAERRIDQVTNAEPDTIST